MRVLLDHCTPRQVAGALPGHTVATSFQMGWHHLENGALLTAAEQAGFEVVVICDKNMRHQQHFSKRKLAILELWTNHRPTLEKHFDLIAAAAQTLQPGEYRKIDAPSL